MKRPPVSVGSLRGMGRTGRIRGACGSRTRWYSGERSIEEGPHHGTDRTALARPYAGRHPGGRRARGPAHAAGPDQPPGARARERLPGRLPAPDPAAAGALALRPADALAGRARARARRDGRPPCARARGRGRADPAPGGVARAAGAHVRGPAPPQVAADLQRAARRAGLQALPRPPAAGADRRARRLVAREGLLRLPVSLGAVTAVTAPPQ